jgi:predicted CXXCH cytochrome family protein
MKGLQASRTVHSPFRKGDCGSCHAPHGSRLENTLVRAVPDLCFQCHQVTPALTQKHQGMSLAGVNCSACHDPHASSGPNLMHSIIHEPFAQGKCSSCHEPGSGKVVSAERELCLSCHTAMEEDLKNEGHVHAAIGGDTPCTACHEPHTARFAHLIPKPTDRLCAECHAGIVTELAKATHGHPAQATGACLVCHSPHLVRDEKGASSAKKKCASCHPFDQHVVHPMGGDVLDPRTKTTLDCLSCHDQHGSDHEYFLDDDPNGRLCVSCHTDKIRTK